jgi:hypothetical protein
MSDEPQTETEKYEAQLYGIDLWRKWNRARKEKEKAQSNPKLRKLVLLETLQQEIIDYVAKEQVEREKPSITIEGSDEIKEIILNFVTAVILFRDSKAQKLQITVRKAIGAYFWAYKFLDQDGKEMPHEEIAKAIPEEDLSEDEEEDE